MYEITKRKSIIENSIYPKLNENKYKYFKEIGKFIIELFKSLQNVKNEDELRKEINILLGKKFIKKNEIVDTDYNDRVIDTKIIKELELLITNTKTKPYILPVGSLIIKDVEIKLYDIPLGSFGNYSLYDNYDYINFDFRPIQLSYKITVIDDKENKIIIDFIAGIVEDNLFYELQNKGINFEEIINTYIIASYNLFEKINKKLHENY